MKKWGRSKQGENIWKSKPKVKPNWSHFRKTVGTCFASENSRFVDSQIEVIFLKFWINFCDFTPSPYPLPLPPPLIPSFFPCPLIPSKVRVCPTSFGWFLLKVLMNALRIHAVYCKLIYLCKNCLDCGFVFCIETNKVKFRSK